ncbi:poly(R)-hydroxyalkanoic acid synthase, class III, PhaC subunit [Candidatus Magnetomorum sp. HK-1]|nr:poly(R)-hydroxyalkanoic acid synthase, class III, PhaC subunit [Candidatus Magnetomorum sp. HK-1]
MLTKHSFSKDLWSNPQVLNTILRLNKTHMDYCTGLMEHSRDFSSAYLTACTYFWNTENRQALFNGKPTTTETFGELFGFNIELYLKSMVGLTGVIKRFGELEGNDTIQAIFQLIFDGNTRPLNKLLDRHEIMLDTLCKKYPQAIEDIASEYGFHFEKGNGKKIAETDRFDLYEIFPSDKSIETRKNAKPVIIVPPYVLGANILSFLPKENRSYAHCFANQGIPTYIRIMKSVHENPAVQILTGEDDVNDTRFFCETVMKNHGRQVTLNGYCQGGFSSLCGILTGKLDGLVDCLITCVSPMDGTRSKGLGSFLKKLPQRYNDLAYGTKTLANGNTIADGKLMGWVYKVKSIDVESPLIAFFKNLMMFRPKNGQTEIPISKTAAAINYWLLNERTDLPLEITRMSFASYNTPITSDGTLPIKLFGKKLNLKRIKERNIPWLICYGDRDDLVEKESALAPLDYVDAEISAFPKGHVAIATSWSNPNSACALHTRFGDNGYRRGPVRYQLDIDEKQSL